MDAAVWFEVYGLIYASWLTFIGWPPAPTAFLDEAALDEAIPYISFEDVDLIEMGGTCYFY